MSAALYDHSMGAAEFTRRRPGSGNQTGTIQMQKETLFENIPEGSFEYFFSKTDGMITLEQGLLLYDLAKSSENGCIVEVGAYRGRSTVALGRGSLDGYRVPVYTIEPHEKFKGLYGWEFGPSDRGAFFKAMLDSGCYHVVRLINMSSEYIAPSWEKDISLLWIDGDHTYKGVRRDFDCWVPFLRESAIVAFDDSLDPGAGPYRLIEELVAEGSFRLVSQVGRITVLQNDMSDLHNT